MKLMSETSERVCKSVVTTLLTDVNAKALCYAVPLFLTPFVDKLGNALMNSEWPTCPQVIYCTLLGLIAMFIGLRAYFDGSYQRSKDENTTTATTNVTTH